MNNIQANAFIGCTSPETLYITDNITFMVEKAFAECPIKKLYINAAHEPVLSLELMAMCSVKFERLMMTKTPKLVLVAGSSSLYGIQSPLLESSIDNAYTVINFGNHAGTSAVFYMEMASAFLQEGDVLLSAPEPIHQQWGGMEFVVRFWQSFVTAYDAISLVDISHYKNVFSTFAEHNKICSQLPAKGYDYHMEYYSNNGDYDLPRRTAHPSYKASPSHSFSTSLQTTAGIAEYNRIADPLRARGVDVLLSFSPVNRSGLTNEGLMESKQTLYEQRADEYYHAVRISEVEDYIMDNEYFYDSNLHLTTEGAEIRTKKLGQDIAAWMESEGKS